MGLMGSELPCQTGGPPKCFATRYPPSSFIAAHDTPLRSPWFSVIAALRLLRLDSLAGAQTQEHRAYASAHASTQAHKSDS